MTGRRTARASGRSNGYRTGRGGKPFGVIAGPVGLLPGTLCVCGHPNCEHAKTKRDGGRPCRRVDIRAMTRCECRAFTKKEKS